jgi:hypothetical protein
VHTSLSPFAILRFGTDEREPEMIVICSEILDTDICGNVLFILPYMPGRERQSSR